MLATYQSLAHLALDAFKDVVANATFLGGTPASPNKLRLTLTDESFIDIWLSSDGDYAYHWELRRQHGRFYRWDNAPHHPRVATFPAHFHDGESSISTSDLSSSPQAALRQILEFVRQHHT